MLAKCHQFLDVSDDCGQEKVAPTRVRGDEFASNTTDAMQLFLNEVRRYPLGHFDLYLGEGFKRAIADQLYFLRRHVGVREAAAVA